MFNDALGFDETRYTCNTETCAATIKNWCICSQSNVYPYSDDISQDVITWIDWRQTLECKGKYDCLQNNNPGDCMNYQCDSPIYGYADINNDSIINANDYNIAAQCVGKSFSYDWCSNNNLDFVLLELYKPAPIFNADETLTRTCTCADADIYNMQPSENVIDNYDDITLAGCTSPKQDWCTPYLEERSDVNQNGVINDIDKDILNYCTGKSVTVNWCNDNNNPNYWIAN